MVYRFKVTVSDHRTLTPDAISITFYIEVSAGNEQAAREMVEYLLDAPWYYLNSCEAIQRQEVDGG